MKNNTLSIVAICLSIAAIAGTIGVHKYAKLAGFTLFLHGVLKRVPAIWHSPTSS
jgi:hypothetical protein